jgi:hypothetical protein
LLTKRTGKQTLNVVFSVWTVPTSVSQGIFESVDHLSLEYPTALLRILVRLTGAFNVVADAGCSRIFKYTALAIVEFDRAVQQVPGGLTQVITSLIGGRVKVFAKLQSDIQC